MCPLLSPVSIHITIQVLSSLDVPPSACHPSDVPHETCPSSPPVGSSLRRTFRLREREVISALTLVHWSGTGLMWNDTLIWQFIFACSFYAHQGVVSLFWILSYSGSFSYLSAAVSSKRTKLTQLLQADCILVGRTSGSILPLTVFLPHLENADCSRYQGLRTEAARPSQVLH